MSAEAVFSLASAAVVPAWLVLLLAPRWKAGPRVAVTVVIALLCATYAALLAWRFPGAEGGFGSLAAVDRLFRDPWLLLAGWIHYLAFDLFAGAWMVRDAQRHAFSHVAVAPALVLTFLAGPVGLLLYLALRYAMRRRVTLDEVV